MFVFNGENPTRLYYDAMNTILESGAVLSPRGKSIKELSPACFEFTNPRNRITFLGSRRVNPFFQFAEALWILSGRADVKWLLQYNKNMGQFSDDGEWFNAPYGERIRTWNKNAAHGVIINPIDQLTDVYTKLKADPDTRQAVVIISNPMFDNSSYTIGEKGKDIACNLGFVFQIREGKLNMTVFNRSNDIHWGVFGANLNQFATIQEVMATWLEVEVGQYNQFTVSLHLYLDDYGAKCTTDVLDHYKSHDPKTVDADFTCVNEPMMSLSKEGFDRFLMAYWDAIDPFLSDDDFLQVQENVDSLRGFLNTMLENGEIDEYWEMAVSAMLAYRLNRLGNLKGCLGIVGSMTDCQWKVSMMYFLKSFIRKVGADAARVDEYQKLVAEYDVIVGYIKGSLVHPEWGEYLEKYLQI